MNSLAKNSIFYRVDKYGVKNYNTVMLIGMALLFLYSIIAIMANFLTSAEAGAEGSNISQYSDAFWTLQMAASTIGFGDHFPVTFWGRNIVALMFYIGVGVAGFIGSTIFNLVMQFSDTNIKNRELRKQNDEILKHNKELEGKIDSLMGNISLLVEQNASQIEVSK